MPIPYRTVLLSMLWMPVPYGTVIPGTKGRDVTVTVLGSDDGVRGGLAPGVRTARSEIGGRTETFPECSVIECCVSSCVYVAVRIDYRVSYICFLYCADTVHSTGTVSHHS